MSQTPAPEYQYRSACAAGATRSKAKPKAMTATPTDSFLVLLVLALSAFKWPEERNCLTTRLRRDRRETERGEAHPSDSCPSRAPTVPTKMLRRRSYYYTSIKKIRFYASE